MVSTSDSIEEELPQDANAAQLWQSLLQLREKHAILMSAAREEIGALRQSLQQAHGELAAFRAEALSHPTKAPVSEKTVTVSQVMHRWIGTASLRSMFQLWYKEAQLERLERIQGDHQAELLDRTRELQHWRSKMEGFSKEKQTSKALPLVPRALLKSWQDSSWQQTMSHFMSVWREQAAESQRHRQAFELFELKAQLQDQELSRAQLRNVWSHAWRQKVLDTALAFRLGSMYRNQLRMSLQSWRAVALVAGTRRQRFLHHRWRQITQLFHAWRLTTLRSLTQDLTRNCTTSKRYLSQLHATAQVVRDHHQRVVKMAVFQVWLQVSRRLGKQPLNQRQN